MQQFFDTLLNGPARYTQEHHLGPGWTLVVVLGALLVEFGVAYALVRLLIFIARQTVPTFRWMLRRFGVGDRHIDYTFLQLTFPATTTKSAYATEQLHILMRGLVKYYSFWERVAARKQPYSLELVATEDDGIRYVIRVPKQEADIVRRTLLSYLPGLKVTEVEDYMSKLSKVSVGVVELKLSNDFILPLGNNKALEEHDPIAYITGHMRSLAPDETVAFQIVSVPLCSDTHPGESRHMRDMRHRISLNKELSTKLKRECIDIPKTLLKIVFAPVWVAVMGIKLVVGIIEAITTNDLPSDWKSSGDKRRADDPYEKELGESIRGKIDQHLFEVTMRIMVASSDKRNINTRLNAIFSSFETFTNPRQTFLSRSDLFRRSSNDLPRFRARELSPHIVSWPTIVSASELADLYHFPNTDLTKTGGLVKSRSRELAAPLSIKHSETKLDVVVGTNTFGGEVQEIGMTLEQRQKNPPQNNNNPSHA